MNMRRKLRVMAETEAANERHIDEWKRGTITGVLIDPVNRIAERRTIVKSLQSYYELLDCTTIDITHRVIGGKTFEIVLDDEGALKEDPVLSAVNNAGQLMLYGKLFVTGYDGGEDLESLSDDDIDLVLENVRAYNFLGFTGVALVCEYR